MTAHACVCACVERTRESVCAYEGERGRESDCASTLAALSKRLFTYKSHIKALQTVTFHIHRSLL